MNNYLSQTISKIRMDAVYSPLKEDEIRDKTPKKYNASSRNLNFLRSSRNLFRNSSRSFKVHRRNVDTTKNTRSKMRALMDELQNKIQLWSQELRNNFHQDQKECKTPNCVTPNRKIRRMLGRTPEQLYSPFSIETPTPSSYHWHKFHESKAEDPFACMHGWLTPPKRDFKPRKPSRSPLFQ